MKIVAPAPPPLTPAPGAPAATPGPAAAGHTPAPIVPPRTNAPNPNGTSPLQVSRFAAALVQQSRSLGQRELIASGNALQSRAAKLGELYQQLVGSQDSGLEDAARNLRKFLLKQRSANLAQVLSYSDGDPAKAHVVLQAARKQAQADGATGEHVVLTQQLKLLRRQYGQRTRAGINSAKAFAKSGVDSKRRGALRNLYGAAVTGQQTITGLIDALLNEREESGDFELNLRDMRSAIADDLSSLTPSTSAQQLRTLMHSLNTARHVATLLQSCEHLLGRMRNKNPGLQIDPAAFLKHLLALSNKGMNLNETLQLTQHIGGKQLKHQLAFLNGLRPMLQQLPILLWRDMKTRQNALGNLLILMAELTRLEQNPTLGGLA
ncbi:MULTISPECIES: type III secretion system gatekeeper subunit SctW [unclassified Pseudomonas]|uniref:type III secretion system gatekeeper subunit SctW n=1 Tax=unclassified Pseudomonas TaxID=196821 RepID=UPI000D3AF3C1|nr:MULTISPECIES: type III secretion system gatekeeper subunit SctW [unclassified Pseudomonas]RAU39494.1 YopN family type III secretion system gatekeeper subunit [Pseudomonas sp. RIT 409]RAU56345.1 YopN family type III secretion system gatekeeper subunit [Pseudomonas sp. RIT 412]